ncbi:glycoside hydrolase family 16 protein [Gaetbulibacter saemankumensis]|uniref:glycoside hydrolase family 16 protein n=1 Tax=Gaetbulibacter saemankumensis TaxID=311208 RepID=UPI0004172CBF|nr:glycoside hydrolase family 16 protein [Gaetbulibacter saemankumensis]
MNINNKLKVTGKLVFRMLVVSILLISVGCSVDENQTVINFKNLVKADEFSVDGAPDNSMWGYDIGTGDDTPSGSGWGNNELQYYTDRLDNVKVEDGMLHIIARKEGYMGAGYTSGRIITRGKFEKAYGRFEAKIQLPWGQGLWPAFWMLGANCDESPWPACGEIDIMENRGQEPTLINGSVHGPGYSAGEAITKSYEIMGDRFDTGFHVFGIEWGPKYINYYVDDVLYNQITPDKINGEWVFDHPFYIILNVAVGGNYVGAPNAETIFPQTMLVDYVRIYE